MQCYLTWGILQIKTFFSQIKTFRIMVFFNSHLTYLCLVWGQAKFSLNRITLLQKRAIRRLHSATYRDHTSPLFHRYKVLKFVDLVSLENCKFVYKCFDDEAFSLFSNHLKLTASSHSYCTRSVSNGLVFKGTLMLIWESSNIFVFTWK